MSDTIARARALLAVATARPWHTDVWYGNDDGGWAAVGPHHMATEDEGYDDVPESPAHHRAMADAALIAAAPELIAALCDQLDDALEECRLKRAADGDFLDDYTDGYLSEVEDQLAAAVAERNALRAEVEKEAAMRAEMAAEIKRLRARKAEVCDCVHGTGMIGESFVDVDANCPKCGGTGGVMVKGDEK